MTNTWDQTRINQFIVDQVEESLTLDYKAAGALAKAKKDEITKDVSAMANSAGGVLLYGVAEFQDTARQHLPERIDPVDRTEFSKEWLEQIINNIRPKINDIIIHPIAINPPSNQVVYVVEIPQGTTAHQAQDKRYYKRFNFMSTPMEDYEIRDVMRRNQYPNIQLEFKLATYQERDRSPEKVWESSMSTITRYRVDVTAVNMGNVFAQYVNTFIHVPVNLVTSTAQNQRKHFRNGVEYAQFTTDNLRENMTTYGPFLPIVVRPWKTLYLESCFDPIECGECEIWWTAHADNAPVISGTILFKDMGEVAV